MLRTAAVAGGCAAAMCLTGLGPGGAGDSGPAAAIVTFCATLLVFAAAPRLRRDDLALATTALCAVCVALRSAIDGANSVGPLGWAVAGVLAAWTPGKVEHMRSTLRHGRAAPARRASDFREQVARRA